MYIRRPLPLRPSSVVYRYPLFFNIELFISLIPYHSSLALLGFAITTIEKPNSHQLLLVQKDLCRVLSPFTIAIIQSTHSFPFLFLVFGSST